jgi:UDP-2,3-diacylglucosamine pyrophosphatase LpxH
MHAIKSRLTGQSLRRLVNQLSGTGRATGESHQALSSGPEDFADGSLVPRFRTIWISDTHLGTRGCNAPALLGFLRNHEADTLYLVGDIVDGWQLKRSWYWPQSHNDIVQKLLRKARKGTRVIYIPGNHDEFFRAYADHSFGGITIRKDVIHVTADGRRLLVLHGDEFDGVVRYARWLALLGDYAYQAILKINQWLNRLRHRLGMPYWSVSAYLKLKVKNAVSFISDFELAIAREARMRGLDGAVCGHIHHATIRTIDGLTYYNDGDWVESCTALVEHHDGAMEILHCPSGHAAHPVLPESPTERT